MPNLKVMAGRIARTAALDTIRALGATAVFMTGKTIATFFSEPRNASTQISDANPPNTPSPK